MNISKTVTVIDMRFFAKVVKPDLTNIHKISGQSVNRAESNLKKSEGVKIHPPPVAYRVKDTLEHLLKVFEYMLLS